jgi:protoporphyrin/coproporphyrin ferrochelatase
MRYLPEPQERPGAGAGTAILLVNLGTPEAPTAPAVRRYLRQFLDDPRVIEIPRAVWLPILYGLVLTTRPKKSAEKYASVWSSEGSPLKVHTSHQASLLRRRFESRSQPPVAVEFAMRYGEPSIPDTLLRLKAAGLERVLVIPLYPQYAASSTASVMDEIAGFVQRVRNVPEIRVVKHFFDDPAYVRALANLVREHWERSGRPDKLLMSFHGLPRYTIERGDPYHHECATTARLLAEELGLSEGQWQIAFQSRFGRTEWIKPYTVSSLADYGSQGLRVDVICPGFVADCLETLEEIGMEGKTLFLRSGGREFHLLPCLNERGDWIDALELVARRHLSGWLGGAADSDFVPAQIGEDDTSGSNRRGQFPVGLEISSKSPS